MTTNKTQLSRRECLGFGALLAATPAIGRSQTSIRPTSIRSVADFAPDLIVVNGNVLTMDDRLPRAEAFAIKDGRFIAVGSSADMRNLASRRTEVIDCERMTITPGFIDAHCHPGREQELYHVRCDLRSIKEIQDALRERAAKTAPGYWVYGFNFDDTKLKDERPLTRKDLDAAVPNHPVRVWHRGGHTAWFNSKAFELAGVTKQTPDPSDGKYYLKQLVGVDHIGIGPDFMTGRSDLDAMGMNRDMWPADVYSDWPWDMVKDFETIIELPKVTQGLLIGNTRVRLCLVHATPGAVASACG